LIERKKLFIFPVVEEHEEIIVPKKSGRKSKK